MWFAPVSKTSGLQVFPAGRTWVRALFGSVRSPVQIRAPRLFLWCGLQGFCSAGSGRGSGAQTLGIGATVRDPFELLAGEVPAPDRIWSPSTVWAWARLLSRPPGPVLAAEVPAKSMVLCGGRRARWRLYAQCVTNRAGRRGPRTRTATSRRRSGRDAVHTRAYLGSPVRLRDRVCPTPVVLRGASVPAWLLVSGKALARAMGWLQALGRRRAALLRMSATGGRGRPWSPGRPRLRRVSANAGVQRPAAWTHRRAGSRSTDAGSKPPASFSSA